jgi:uncharacterized protein (TIGR02099 family)
MDSRLKKILRRARTLLWTALSILVVLAAVVMGIGKLLMPYSDRYQPRLEAWLSEEFGRPVLLESFEGEWTAFGPRLSLRGMQLLPAGATASSGPPNAVGAEGEVAIESAALDIRPLNLLLPGRPLYNFRVSGAHFELSRNEHGEFRLSGFGVTGRGRDPQGSALRELARVGEVILEDSRLEYLDQASGIRLGLRDIRGRLQLENEELSSEIRANLHDERSGLVFGEIQATVLLALGEDQRLNGARWQATTRELMLAALQGRVPANPFLPLAGWLNAEVWGHWSPAGGHSARGVVDLKEARLANEYQDLWLERANTRFQWRSQGRRDWSLHLADFFYDDGDQAWRAPRLSLARNKAEGLGLWISADRLPLGVPLQLARNIMSIYGTAWPSSLPGAASGQVSGLDLVLDSSWRLQLARGEVTKARVSEWNRWPDLNGLDASVELGRNSGQVQLSGEAVEVVWPRMFREPVTLTVPTCTVAIDWGDGWQAGLSACAIENEDLAVHGGALLSSNEGRPAIDLNAAVTRGSIGRLGPYWPEAHLNDRVKSWLRAALAAGEIVSGRVQIRGDLDDWPFRQGEGRFDAIARVADGHLKYQTGWPDARSVDVVARFAGPGMDIRGRVADIGGLAAGEVRAAITDFSAPMLTVDYTADSDVPGLLGFLRRTPLQERVGADLERFEFAGPAAVRGSLRIPFGSVPGELAVDGTVTLNGSAFADPDTGFTLSGIAGVVEYNERGFTADALEAEYRGKPARLGLVADAAAAEPFRADLRGTFGISDVIPGFLVENIEPLLQAQGESVWTASVVVLPAGDAGGAASRAEGGAEGGARAVLRVASQLQGLALNLPAPLGKTADESWPLSLRLPLSGTQRLLELEIEGRLAMALEFPDGAAAPRAAAVWLGEGRAELPPLGLLRVAGWTDLLDLDGWLELIVEEAGRERGMAELVLEPGGLRARELLFLDRSFADVAMQFSVESSVVRAEFSSADISGKVRYTAGSAGTKSLSAEFERLALGEPRSDPLADAAEVETNPAELPSLHLYAQSLRYAGIELGETRVEAYPIANGFHFERVQAESERLTLRAKGDWLLDERGHRSDFDIRIASESLGGFLESLDIASPVQGGQTLVYFNAWWPGSPGAFGLSRLNGEGEFSVVDGNISNASAGGGRLLGLLSVQALPKRLALDFRDVFDSGFSFDEASGTFAMENGTASTDNVLLRSSAASISVSGRTDLVAREYDQLITVRPGVGNTLPIIGALAGGPGGAAAGLALQGLLHDSLAEATQVRYLITGSWENPIIEPVAVEQPEG